MRKHRKLYSTALLLAGASFTASLSLNAAQLAANSTHYEKDGWLDITEWFDGNNYNPTDEAWWRFDDETYQASRDTGGDNDNDLSYGFSGSDNDNWYYDWYDPYSYGYYDYDNNDVYEFGSEYYDHNNDGIYDAYAWYSDRDGDGIYDDYDYYSFTEDKDNQQKGQKQKATLTASKQQSLTGRVQKTKLVKARGGKQHVVVALQPQGGQQNQPVVVDLGDANNIKNVNPKLGDTITVKGPRATVGKQSVVLARSIDVNGQTKQINRNARTITGKVTDVHRTKNRGQENLLAMVESDDSGKKQKIAVDLGPADRLKMDVKKGSTLTFSGFPVKANDKLLIMAQSVERNDQLVQINRQSSAVGASGTQQKGKNQSGSR